MFHIHRIVAVIFLTCICALWPLDMQARTTNAFQIGQILSADQLSKIPKTRLAVYEQTVGRIRQKAVLKYGKVDAYIQARGVKATAGKVFEAMTVNHFRAYAKNGEKMVTSVIFGVSDVGFDYAHSRRLDSRSRQLARLDVHSKHEVVDQLLRSMIDDPSE